MNFKILPIYINRKYFEKSNEILTSLHLGVKSSFTAVSKNVGISKKGITKHARNMGALRFSKIYTALGSRWRTAEN